MLSSRPLRRRRLSSLQLPLRKPRLRRREPRRMTLPPKTRSNRLRLCRVTRTISTLMTPRTSRKLLPRSAPGLSLSVLSPSPISISPTSRSHSCQTSKSSASSTASICICSSPLAASAATASKSRNATSSADPPCSSTVDSCKIYRCIQSIPKLLRRPPISRVTETIKSPRFLMNEQHQYRGSKL